MQVNPLGAETERLTVPVKPASGLIVMFEDADAPARAVKLVGFAERLKSVTFRVKLNPYPLVPEFPCPPTLFVEVVQVEPGFSVSVLEDAPCAGS